MAAYYNEIDPHAAAWLRELIKRDLIAPGDVDERSIEDITPDEIRKYTQCHFFAGIGTWSHALRRAGWSDERPVWTGSCPCQPFSAAGKGGGVDDERHLWPHWHHLITECRPGTVLGEQVASKDGLGWLDLVSADMEGTGYAFGANDLCAAGFGAPHIRQRLFFGAYDLRSAHGHLGNSDNTGLEVRGQRSHQFNVPQGRENEKRPSGLSGVPGSMAITNGGECDGGASTTQRHLGHRQDSSGKKSDGGPTICVKDDERRPGPVNGFWRPADWIVCHDERWRCVEPGTFPLADGPAARVVRLRGYGNGIVEPVAVGFIEAFMASLEEARAA